MDNERRILAIAMQRMNDNRDLLLKFAAMDNMKHVRWTATWENPDDRPDWWRDMPSAQPKNDINAATRMYATVSPIVKITPQSDTARAKTHCNDVESALMWQYQQASERGEGNTTYTLIENIMLYGKSCAQVIYLPWQNKINQDLGVQRWNVQGDYAILPHHPSEVYEQTSSLYGLQNVLLIKDMYGDDIVSMWGDSEAAEVKKIIDGEADGQRRRVFRVYDWTDDKHRVFMAQDLGANSMPQETRPTTVAANVTPRGAGNLIIIHSAEHKLPFLNWAIRTCGSDTEKNSADKVSPLMDTLYEGNQYNSINIWRSVVRSSALATMLLPQTVSKTMNGEAPMVDNTMPGGNVPLQPNESFDKMPPPQLDPRAMQLMDEDAQEIGEGTVPKMIVSPSMQRGVSFAAVNQMYNAAEAVLYRYANTAEHHLADIHKLMMMWKIHSGDPLSGFEMKKNKKGMYSTGKSLDIAAAVLPRRHSIPDDVASPYAIYLDVKLTAKLPIDEVQKLNGGNIMRQLGLPDETVYEELGFPNPDELVRGRYRQQYLEAAMAIGLEKLKATGQAGAQTIIGEAQLELQKKSQPQPQGAPPAPDSQPPQQPTDQSQAAGGMPTATSGGQMSQVTPHQLNPDQMRQQAYAKAAGGDGGGGNANLDALVAAAKGGNFKPAEGGTPPATLAPMAMTKEAVTGRTRHGGKVKRGK